MANRPSDMNSPAQHGNRNDRTRERGVADEDVRGWSHDTTNDTEEKEFDEIDDLDREEEENI